MTSVRDALGMLICSRGRRTLAMAARWLAGRREAVDLFTIGHGNLDVTQFLAALRCQGITRVMDVRSIPHSRYVPWTSHARLAAELESAGIAYEFRGKE